MTKLMNDVTHAIDTTLALVKAFERDWGNDDIRSMSDANARHLLLIAAQLAMVISDIREADLIAKRSAAVEYLSDRRRARDL